MLLRKSSMMYVSDRDDNRPIIGSKLPIALVVAIDQPLFAESIGLLRTGVCHSSRALFQVTQSIQNPAVLSQLMLQPHSSFLPHAS